MIIEERLISLKNGHDSKLYDFLGSHIGTKDDKQGVYFRVYSPNASGAVLTVSLSSTVLYSSSKTCAS